MLLAGASFFSRKFKGESRVGSATTSSKKHYIFHSNSQEKICAFKTSFKDLQEKFFFYKNLLFLLISSQIDLCAIDVVLCGVQRVIYLNVIGSTTTNEWKGFSSLFSKSGLSMIR